MSIRIPRVLIIFGALLVIVGSVFKLMHWGVGFLQANTLLGAGVILIVIALVIIALSRLANK
jgi:hypothetical protein